MKTSTATALGVTTLTVAVVGFGASVPSLADNLGLVAVGSTDDSATTSDGTGSGTTDEGTTEGTEGTDGTQDGTEDDWAERGPGGHHGMRGGPGMGGMGLLDTAAETLGLTEEELMTQLQDGSTLGEIADAQGVDRQTLVDALLAEQEQRITDMLDESMPARPEGFPGRPGSDDGSSSDGSTGTTQDGSTTSDASFSDV